jgi:predicted helicase
MLIFMAPFYLLLPQNNQLLEECDQSWKITEILPVNVLGFQTHRDHFAIDFDTQSLCQKILDMQNKSISNCEYLEKYKIKDSSSWKIEEVRKKACDDSEWERHLISCSYRPFDNRPCCFSEIAMDRPRRELMDHVANRENLCLLSSRQQATVGYRHSWVANKPANDCVISTTSREANQVFPLYLYFSSNDFQKSTFEEQRHPNLSQLFLKDITDRLGYTPAPEAIFYYIYAILHSPTYRTRYAEFLKIDFPRVPLTSNDALFRQLAAYGEQLVALHLMKSSKLDRPITQFVEQDGKAIVDPGHPKYSNGKVTINKKGDGFVGIPETVWNFYVGGYQVCAKWLKDRKGRTLTQDDIVHYQRIVVALGETIKLMEAIDQAIPGFPIL